MNAIAQRQDGALSTSVDNAALIEVLRNSLYPGASIESVQMVLSYCRAADLDPMQKPVHIVPMWNNALGKLVDQVMPGIGLYRIQASRTGQYAGVSDPDFGPDVTEEIGGLMMTYPASCKVTVRRVLPCGQVCDFSAVERWKENYATKKNNVTTPNAMWARRPYAQLAKCAEAQALRKAFPEVGSQPTADEMEGKVLEEVRDITPRTAEQHQQQEPPGLPGYDQAKFEAILPTWRSGVETAKTTPESLIAFLSTKYTLNEQQLAAINALKPIEGEIAE